MASPKLRTNRLMSNIFAYDKDKNKQFNAEENKRVSQIMIIHSDIIVLKDFVILSFSIGYYFNL